MRAEVDLLGDPRLKDGLAYYPAIQTQHGSIVLGNIVQLALKADEKRTYFGYGFLKGIWRWRGEPYVRVQHLAPCKNVDMPADAVAFTVPVTPGREELMVTNRVSDLHASQLVRAVLVKDTPLKDQLFQENVSPTAPEFRCTRHLDVAVQSTHRLDEGFRFTPVIVPFGIDALRCASSIDSSNQPSGSPVSKEGASTLGALVRDPVKGAAGSPGEQALATSQGKLPSSQRCLLSQPSPQNQTGLPSPQLSISLSSKRRSSGQCSPRQPAMRTAVDLSSRQPSPWRSSTPKGAGFSSSSLHAQAEIPAASCRTLLKREKPRRRAPSEAVSCGSLSGHRSKAAPTTTESRPPPLTLPFLPARDVLEAPPLINACLRGSRTHAANLIRCPDDFAELRSRLALQFEISEQSIKLEYQSAQQGRWVELTAIEDVKRVWAKREQWWVTLYVSGQAPFNLTVHALNTVLSLSSLVVSFAYLASQEWTRSLYGTPLYLIHIPLFSLAYSVVAFLASLYDEYRSNPKMRKHTDTIGAGSGSLALLALLAPLGPDMLLLAQYMILRPLGPSGRCKLVLTSWSLGTHVLVDLPIVLEAVLAQVNLGRLSDSTLQVAVGLCLASLIFKLPWNLATIGTAWLSRRAFTYDSKYH
ncbi:hypothetical protein AB1Y20_002080 [Prymnesium parvum]|uniref:Uncharacterized protein n=1 Tax=Prymnesium parvum TaxID=97485 RepID=A0AB34J9C0_PRYPA